MVGQTDIQKDKMLDRQTDGWTVKHKKDGRLEYMSPVSPVFHSVVTVSIGP